MHGGEHKASLMNICDKCREGETITTTTMTRPTNQLLLAHGREGLDRFFATYPNPRLEKRARNALRMLAAAEKPCTGNAKGWVAGVIYAMANLDRHPVGVPGLLNTEFTTFFGVSMATVRRRAAQVVRQIES